MRVGVHVCAYVFVCVCYNVHTMHLLTSYQDIPLAVTICDHLPDAE